MTPHEAIVLAAVLIIAAIAGIYAVTRALQAQAGGKHARKPFADPADDDDPDGAEYIAVLHHEGPPVVVPRSYDKSPPAAARLLEALRGWATRPADDTQPIPHAVGTWGMPAHELADQLARTYLEVKR